jgi:hypothetical protein
MEDTWHALGSLPTCLTITVELSVSASKSPTPACSVMSTIQQIFELGNKFFIENDEKSSKLILTLLWGALRTRKRKKESDDLQGLLMGCFFQKKNYF